MGASEEQSSDGDGWSEDEDQRSERSTGGGGWEVWIAAVEDRGSEVQTIRGQEETERKHWKGSDQRSGARSDDRRIGDRANRIAG